MNERYLSQLKLDNFTAFQHIEVDFTPGINVFIGKNGTGKTHLLKLLYAACAVTLTKESIAEKILRCFQPYQNRMGRLVYRTKESISAKIEVFRGDDTIRVDFSNHTEKPSQAIETELRWNQHSMECAYIPVKEMLSHAPGFRSLYEKREISFDETYRDIIDRAFLPILKGPKDSKQNKLLRIITDSLQGKVYTSNETFFLDWKNKGDLEFSLVAEGLRKLALLWVLIQNGTLLNGSILFWDEPESNLNPTMMRNVVQILIELQRMGVQIFLASHDYVFLKEFDLQSGKKDHILFHALYPDIEKGEIRISSTNDYLHIHPNSISDTFLDLYDRDIEKNRPQRSSQ